MIATALAAVLLLNPVNDADAIAVSPSHVEITDLRPGTTGAVDVMVTNTSGLPAQVSVTGELSSTHLVGEEDLLQVSLAGCAQPWAGVPAAPTDALVAPVCPGGQVPASSGSLAAVPLEAGEPLHLLISASLGENAGNDAQGQTWTATFNVRLLSAEPPAPLAITGARVSQVGAAAVVTLVGGALLRVAGTRTRTRRRTR